MGIRRFPFIQWNSLLVFVIAYRDRELLQKPFQWRISILSFQVREELAFYDFRLCAVSILNFRPNCSKTTQWCSTQILHNHTGWIGFLSGKFVKRFGVQQCLGILLEYHLISFDSNDSKVSNWNSFQVTNLKHSPDLLIYPDWWSHFVMPRSSPNDPQSTHWIRPITRPIPSCRATRLAWTPGGHRTATHTDAHSPHADCSHIVNVCSRHSDNSNAIGLRNRRWTPVTGHTMCSLSSRKTPVRLSSPPTP